MLWRRCSRVFSLVGARTIPAVSVVAGNDAALLRLATGSLDVGVSSD